MRCWLYIIAFILITSMMDFMECSEEVDDSPAKKHRVGSPTNEFGADAYEQGYKASYDQGYQQGFNEGWKSGWGEGVYRAETEKKQLKFDDAIQQLVETEWKLSGCPRKPIQASQELINFFKATLEHNRKEEIRRKHSSVPDFFRGRETVVAIRADSKSTGTRHLRDKYKNAHDFSGQALKFAFRDNSNVTEHILMMCAMNIEAIRKDLCTVILEVEPKKTLYLTPEQTMSVHFRIGGSYRNTWKVCGAFSSVTRRAVVGASPAAVREARDLMKSNINQLMVVENPYGSNFGRVWPFDLAMTFALADENLAKNAFPIFPANPEDVPGPPWRQDPADQSGRSGRGGGRRGGRHGGRRGGQRAQEQLVPWPGGEGEVLVPPVDELPIVVSVLHWDGAELTSASSSVGVQVGIHNLRSDLLMKPDALLCLLADEAKESVLYLNNAFKKYILPGVERLKIVFLVCVGQRCNFCPAGCPRVERDGKWWHPCKLDVAYVADIKARNLILCIKGGRDLYTWRTFTQKEDSCLDPPSEENGGLTERTLEQVAESGKKLDEWFEAWQLQCSARGDHRYEEDGRMKMGMVNTFFKSDLFKKKAAELKEAGERGWGVDAELEYSGFQVDRITPLTNYIPDILHLVLCMGRLFLDGIILELLVDIEREFPGCAVFAFLLATEVAGVPALGRRMLEHCAVYHKEYLQGSAGLPTTAEPHAHVAVRCWLDSIAAALQESAPEDERAGAKKKLEKARERLKVQNLLSSARFTRDPVKVLEHLRKMDVETLITEYIIPEEECIEAARALGKLGLSSIDMDDVHAKSHQKIVGNQCRHLFGLNKPKVPKRKGGMQQARGEAGGGTGDEGGAVAGGEENVAAAGAEGGAAAVGDEEGKKRPGFALLIEHLDPNLVRVRGELSSLVRQQLQTLGLEKSVSRTAGAAEIGESVKELQRLTRKLQDASFGVDSPEAMKAYKEHLDAALEEALEDDQDQLESIKKLASQIIDLYDKKDRSKKPELGRFAAVAMDIFDGLRGMLEPLVTVPDPETSVAELAALVDDFEDHRTKFLDAVATAKTLTVGRVIKFGESSDYLHWLLWTSKPQYLDMLRRWGAKGHISLFQAQASEHLNKILADKVSMLHSFTSTTVGGKREHGGMRNKFGFFLHEHCLKQFNFTFL